MSSTLEANRMLNMQCCLALLNLRIAIHKIARQAQTPGMSQARDMESSICAGILSYCYSLERTTVAGDKLVFNASHSLPL